MMKFLQVTNLVEMGKRKCHKYWPEETEQYGTIRVSLNDTEELCDFTIRTFVIQQVCLSSFEHIDSFLLRIVCRFFFHFYSE